MPRARGFALPVATREKILVALSGGVDSSVAAFLLREAGHEVVGAYMKNWINEDNVLGYCPWQQDIDDARSVADRLGIEFRIVNLMRDYRRLVVDYLLEGYQRGQTPNPDVMCNREMKFGVFLNYARKEGFAAVATGHYARRVASDSADTGVGLREGSDRNKDQSYFLALLSQAQVEAARFPIGHLTKPELRRIARTAGLVTADKKDSQGICFIGEVKMADFLRAHVPEQPGPIIRATDGQEIGRHRGLHFFTLGQRRGIGVPSNTENTAYVVVGKRVADRALLVAFDGPDAPGLWSTTSRLRGLSFIGRPITGACRIECRVRYRDPRVSIVFEPDEATPTGGAPGSARVTFDRSQRALATGQIIALYAGERLLGGGVFA